MNTTNSKASWQIIRVTIVLVFSIVTSLGCSHNQPPPTKIKVPPVPPPVVKPEKPIKVALVLSSGGFRGVAHVGVLEVLEEHNIPVDLIVGSSAGSFIGAFYADEPNAALLKEKLMHARYENFIDSTWVRVIRSAFTPSGPVYGIALQQFMLKHMRSRDFNELKIPLAVVTTSLLSNQMEVLQSGPIIPAVHASAALPPYFAPVSIYENFYVDGAVIAPVPVSVAREYNPRLVIAVDICKKPSLSELHNAFQITGRALDISFYELARRQASAADIVIRPEIIGYGPFEDDYNEEFYQAGRKAALEQIDAIKEAFLKIKG